MKLTFYVRTFTLGLFSWRLESKPPSFKWRKFQDCRPHCFRRRKCRSSTQAGRSLARRSWRAACPRSWRPWSPASRAACGTSRIAMAGRTFWRWSEWSCWCFAGKGQKTKMSRVSCEPVFYSTSLPLASTRWIRSTVKHLLHSPHTKQCTAVNKSQQHKKFQKILGRQRIKPGAAGREARMISIVLCVPPPPIWTRSFS